MGLKIAILVVIMIFVGFVGQELNIGVDPIVDMTSVLEPTGNGVWDAIKSALAPLIWGFNAIASFFQLMTWQAEGLPTLVNVLFTAIGFFMGYTLISFVRGS